jgi:hypothetical protein
MERMKKILFFLLCLVSSAAMGSHIVGGEFELLYLSGNTYRLRMILYFDKKNGSPGALDPFARVRIFSKATNQIILNDIQLDHLLALDEQVEYSQLECSKGELITERLIYQAELTLDPSQFSDPAGYYVAWERCCRNYDIKNIYSARNEDANFLTEYAGQTFYLEFPPLIKNGKRFINSSPKLFAPLSDYACPNKLYFVNFGGVDDDGDSLVYSLVTPLNTHEAAALPASGLPGPAPYPLVKWKPGFTDADVMKGDPRLWISREGYLRVAPTLSGLFVFAVKCEEFRDGEKIGEVRRDFQMLVVDYCPSSEAPEIVGKTAESPSYTDQELVVSFSNDVTDENRCIEVVVTDPDAFNAAENYSEIVRIEAIPIGFKADVSGVLPTVKKATLTRDNSEVHFDVCFDKCPYTKDGHFKIAIVAYDDACSQPLSDSLWVDVTVQPPVNEDPYFETGDVDDGVEINTQQSWDVKGLDPDTNPVEVYVITGGFDLDDFGFHLETTLLEAGKYNGIFSWAPDCNVMDFSERRDFNIQLVLNDLECDLNEPDTMTFDLHVNIPENMAPELTVTSATAIELIDNTITADVHMPIVLDIISKDQDVISPQNQITILLDTALSKLPEGYLFTPVTGINIANTNFSWTPDCDIFTDNTWTRDYKFVFRTYDRSCVVHKEDTVSIDATVNDIDSKREAFLPPNLITPNSDGFNDFFGLDEIVKISEGDVLPNLPLDNCAGHFLSIEIFNRWGKKVFESDKRNFRWYANNAAAGIYFYTVQYTNAKYKGSLSVKY